MPRPRRKGTSRLTEDQLWELCSIMYGLIERRSAFASEEERRRAWFDNREAVLRFYRTKLVTAYERDPRPLAFYVYEAPGTQRENTFPVSP